MVWTLQSSREVRTSLQHLVQHHFLLTELTRSVTRWLIKAMFTGSVDGVGGGRGGEGDLCWPFLSFSNEVGRD